MSAPARPLVSVCMITYNHEAYIGRAIESVLSQRGEFDLELVIGEDCSTDSTRQIIERYASANPKIVRPLLRENNLGSSDNFRDTFDSCRGKYLAILDGDDYWTDPQKLAHQVGLMEADPAIAISYHPVEVKPDDTDEHAGEVHRPLGRHPAEGHRPIRSIEALLSRRALEMQTCSVVLNRELVGPFPAWIAEAPQGDWPLFVHSATRGTVGYVDETMAVYQVHRGGTWSSVDLLDRIDRATRVNVMIRDHIDARYRTLMNRRIAWNDATKSIALADSGDRAGARRSARRALAGSPAILVSQPRLASRMIAFAFAPELSRVLRKRAGRARASSAEAPREAGSSAA